jgi:uncharacterized protein YlxW (UPF0749 family)
VSETSAVRNPGEGKPPVRFAPDFLTDLFRHPLEPGYAEAARRRASQARDGGPAPARWRRLPVKVSSVVAIAAIGFLLVVAYQHVLADEPERARARAGLVSEINSRQTDTDALRRQADQLRQTVAQERDAALDDTAAARLHALEATTGLAQVRGGGVVVKVADAKRSVDAVTGQGSNADLGRVLDRDLQQIANALWRAGAEAVSINGQRLISTSTIRAAGSAILVDFRPVSGPYEVTAIGPDNLESQFNNSKTARTFHQLVDQFGMSFSVRHKGDLTIPAASEPQLRYASPLKSSSPTPSAAPAGSPSKGGR